MVIYYSLEKNAAAAPVSARVKDQEDIVNGPADDDDSGEKKRDVSKLQNKQGRQE